LALKKKIVLLGDSAVGKTSLIRRFVFDQFEDSYIATIGSKVTRKEVKIHHRDETVKLKFMIWDVIGREGYYSLHARTLIGVKGAIIVSDLTRKETLNTLEQFWIPFLFKIVGHVPLVFACNKSDLKSEFKFDPQELLDVSNRYNGKLERYLPYGYESSYPTSAKDGSNVEKAFETIGHLILSSHELVDPVKELYESIVAMGVSRTSDKTSAVGALDMIIVDFCEGFSDQRLAMTLLRQELTRASVDINNPTKEGVLRTVEYLGQAENEFMDEKVVVGNLKKRLELANNIEE
jgi:small GTP-binding protein